MRSTSLVDHFSWTLPHFFGAARFPINALYVVGEDYASCAMTGGNGHFEWVSFRLIRNRAYQRQEGFRVVQSRTQHQYGTPSGLLPAGLRIERQPDEITGLWYVRDLHQDSLPFGCPQCVSR